MCSYSEHNTCGVRGKDISGGMNIPYVELDKTSKSPIMVGGAVMAKLAVSMNTSLENSHSCWGKAANSIRQAA